MHIWIYGCKDIFQCMYVRVCMYCMSVRILQHLDTAAAHIRRRGDVSRLTIFRESSTASQIGQFHLDFHGRRLRSGYLQRRLAGLAAARVICAGGGEEGRARGRRG